LFRDSDGVSRQVERWASTKAKAETMLKSALVERQSPAKAEGGMRPDLTMMQAGKVWIELNEYANLSAKTRTQYRQEFERYIVGSSIQGLTLREANNIGTLERFLQHIADENGSGAAKAARRVLSNMLNTAVRHRALPYSASRDVRQPRPRTGSASATRAADGKHDIDRAFSRDERALVLKVADADPDDKSLDVADLIAFLAGTGVRLSEALECTSWADVDLDGTDANGDPAPTVHVRGTKTDKADRVLPLPPWLAERLRERAATRGTDGLVFGSPRLHDKTRPRERRNILRHIRTRLDEAGMPWATSHTFRRTVATWMDEAGAPLAEIANQLGHANVNVTATYLGRRQGSNRAATVL
jgi:integrase